MADVKRSQRINPDNFPPRGATFHASQGRRDVFAGKKKGSEKHTGSRLIPRDHSFPPAGAVCASF